MANEKILNTRIQLRYDSLSAWTASNPSLKDGDVAVAYLPPKGEGAAPAAVSEAVLIKVGPGKFNSLPYVSALAADVYSWAKKSETEFTTWVKGLIDVGDIDLSNYYNKSQVDGLLSQNSSADQKYAKDYADSLAGNYDAKDTAKGLIEALDVADTAVAGKYVSAVSETDGKISVTREDLPTYTLAEGSANGTVKFNGTDVAVHGLQDAAYATVASLNATAKGYADAVEAKIPTELGVMSVANADDTIVVEGTTNVTIKVASGKFDAAGAAAGVQANLTSYENTHASDYTNAKIDELVQGAKNYADANDANTEYHVEYDSTNKKIKLVAGADSSKMEIDARAFIKDGMISSVELDANHDLVISFNTDAGEEDIVVPLDELIDIYTGVSGSRVAVSVSSDNKISADIVAGSISKNYLDTSVQTSLGKADSALQSHQDISHLALAADLTKVVNGTTPVAKATDADKLGGQLPSYYATASSVTDITKNNGTIDSKIAAYNSSKNFGDIITHNVSEFATSTQGSTADSALQSVKVLGTTLTKTSNELTVDAAKTALGLKSAAYTESSAYATSAQGAKADSAVQGVSNVANNGLVMSKSADNKVSVDWDSNVVFVFNCGNASTYVD